MKYSSPTTLVGSLRDAARPGAPVVADAAPSGEDPALLVARIRGGMPFAEFTALAAWLELPDERLAPLIGISRATLHRRRKAGRLEPPECERIIRFARLLRRATELFEDEGAARDWLKAPAFAFNGECPLSFADTEVGAREVEALLGRIGHGVFS